MRENLDESKFNSLMDKSMYLSTAPDKSGHQSLSKDTDPFSTKLMSSQRTEVHLSSSQHQHKSRMLSSTNPARSSRKKTILSKINKIFKKLDLDEVYDMSKAKDLISKWNQPAL